MRVRDVPIATMVLIAMLAGYSNPVPVSGQSLDESVTRYVGPYVEAGDFAGVVLLADHGGVVLERAFGRAAAAPAMPRSIDQKFRIGSVSKQFTAAAILLLAEDGKITLSEPLARWFPDGSPLHEVTAHQLLTHTAGVPDIYELEAYPDMVAGGWSLARVVGELEAESLRFEPGSSYAYSNGGYIVLARLVELAAGQSFEDVLRERIFAPLGLVSTGSEPRTGPVEGQARPYDPAGRAGVSEAPALDLGVLRGAGSLYSSANDLYRWLRSLHDGELLSAESWAWMTTDHGNGYGYGVSVYARGGRPVLGHDGRVAGGISDVTLYLDDGSAVVVVGNVQSGVADEFRRDLARLLVREEVVPRLRENRDAARPEDGSGWEPTTAELDALEGRYRFHPGLVVAVRQEGGRLLVRANRGAESDLVPMERGVFFSRMLYANVEFESAAGGRQMVWSEGGNRWVGILETD